jgi:SAM-dependent methyltransferase
VPVSSDAEIILQHYRDEAARHGAEPSSTMRDAITRDREVDGIVRAIAHARRGGDGPARLLEVGCGNGHLLEILRGRFPDLALSGVDATPEMIDLARGRGVPGAELQRADARALPFADGAFDLVVTERCVINVLDVDGQAAAFGEIARVLRPGGHYVCVEAFADGLAELNAARDELGLPPNVVPHHNRWLDKTWFLETITSRFAIVEPPAGPDGFPPSNFLSSHYFVSRVFYPAVTRREIRYNTHFVRFFAALPPQGDYAPIQFYLLRRR